MHPETSRRVQRLLPPLLAVLPALWIAWPLLRETPLSFDHATHLFKSWHFVEEMLGRGRLRGWSHLWGFGFPSDELVPPGGEVWVALVRLLTLGQLSWLRTYALAYGAFLVFIAWAAYRFTRESFGTVAAIVCAWITALDPGGMLEGGWEWHGHFGVWPVSLAMAFVALALLHLQRVVAGAGTRDLVVAGLWVGAALLTHQLALVVFAIIMPILVLDHTTRPGGVRWDGVARSVLALAFGGLVSAYFMVPFVARSAYTQDLGWLGESLPVVSQHVLEFRVFQRTAPVVHALALLGGWFVLRRRTPGGRYFVLCGAVLVVFASGTLVRDLHLERVLPGLVKVEANRFLLVAKLFWFALAGRAVAELLGCCPRDDDAPPRWASRAWRWAGATGLALVLVVPAYRHIYDTQIEKEIVSESERAFWPDLVELWRFTAGLERPEVAPFRIAYMLPRGDHLPTAAAVFDGLPIYKVGNTPTQIFDAWPTTHEHALFEALSVKYVVSSKALEHEAFTLVRRFGALWFYTFHPYRPDPFTVLGPGRAELLEFSPDRLRIGLSGTDATTRLKVHVANYPRWEATQDGKVLPITTVPALGAEYPILMEFPVGDGEVALRYVARGVDWLGFVLTLAAVPMLLAALWLDRRFSAGTRLHAAIERTRRPLALASAAIVVAVLVVVSLGTRTRERLLPRASLFRHLEAGGELLADGHACERRAALSYRCGPHRVQADVAEGAWGVHRCMTAPTAERLELRVRAELRSFLSAHYDTAIKGSGTIRVSVDGETLGKLRTRPAFLRHQKLAFDTRARRGQTADIRVTLTGLATRCFDIAPTD